MAIMLDIPETLEQELSDEAAQFGLSLPEYVARLLALRPSLSSQPKHSPPKTGAELVAYWQAADLIGTRSDISDSQQHARQIREKAEKRYRISDQ